MSKTRVEYTKEKALLGDLYKAVVYEEHNNTPGFAPEIFDVKICEIWTKYRDWNRRIHFNDTKLEHQETLDLISKIFTDDLDESLYQDDEESLRKGDK